ncbi:MAG: SpoIIE family protein phosphatase, partial [Bacteroidia bacterium]|nr:SpoIIE family protein phosphatase [Bacteroidia bacterium]
KANKQPIGKTDNPEPFTTHTIELQKGDSLYLFTDGFADQFGGPKGKKFKYKQLEDLLVASKDLSINEQHLSLKNALNSWKGNLEQVDDICIIGIKV